MAKLRHIAICVSDLEKAAAFYEKVFEMERVGDVDADFGAAIYLSDGTVNLALLKYKTDAVADPGRGKGYVGVHHFGFWVDSLDSARARIESNGGHLFFDMPDHRDAIFYEMKFKDPDGIIFDISHKGWAGTSK